MKKSELIAKVDTTISEAKSGLQEWYDNTPKGVRKQLAKNPAIVKTWEVYGVEYEK